MTKLEYKDLLIKTSSAGLFPCYTTNKNGSASCLYKSSDNGRKCAVGLLIPDDRYRTLFEGANFTEVVDKGIGDNMPEGVTIEDLQKIQRCHDFQACDIQKGRSTAWDHNLFVSAITTILGE